MSVPSDPYNTPLMSGMEPLLSPLPSIDDSIENNNGGSPGEGHVNTVANNINTFELFQEHLVSGSNVLHPLVSRLVRSNVILVVVVLLSSIAVMFPSPMLYLLNMCLFIILLGLPSGVYFLTRQDAIVPIVAAFVVPDGIVPHIEYGVWIYCATTVAICIVAAQRLLLPLFVWSARPQEELHLITVGMVGFLIPRLVAVSLSFQFDHPMDSIAALNTISYVIFVLIVSLDVAMYIYELTTSHPKHTSGSQDGWATPPTSPQFISPRSPQFLPHTPRTPLTPRTPQFPAFPPLGQEAPGLVSDKYDFMQWLVQKVSHPMNGVTNNVQHLVATQLTDWQSRCVSEINQAADDLLNVLQDIKYLLDVEYGSILLEATPFNLIDVLEDVLEKAAKILSKTHHHPDLELVYKVADNVPLGLIGDAKCLVQLLYQLVQYSVRCTEQGEVGVRVSVVSTHEERVELHVEVFDTGPGMTEEEVVASNSYQPFPVVGNAGKRSRGTGLSLVVSHKLVHLLGGSLEVHSYTDGALFVMNLPYTVDPDSAGSQSVSLVLDPALRDAIRDLHVLVVDENDIARATAASLLRMFGCRVSEASGGVQCIRELKLAQEAKDPYKVVVIDYRMPGMDGLETTRMLKEDATFANLCVILSLSPVDVALKSYISRAGHKYLIKPIQRKKLIRALQLGLGIAIPQNPNQGLGASRDRPQEEDDEVEDDQATTVGLLKVLVADDSMETQREIQGLVESMGHSCTVVSDGVAAVAHAKRSHWDLILMDLYMPILDGFRATELIRSQERDAERPTQTQRVPIIGLTYTQNEEERSKCFATGMDEYIDKSFLSSAIKMSIINMEKRKVAHTGEAPRLFEMATSRKLSGSTPTGGDARLGRRIEQLENLISRFVPREFQDLIAPDGMENASLGDAICRTITIFFSDIRNFTSMTEKMHVSQVIEFLNTYLAFAIPAITEKGGFIDKFIGDAIMGLFPHTDTKEQAISSVSAAIGVMKALDFMRESGFDAVETGIGINTGKTIIGIVGTETRMEPTALGDAVNLASRTEALCKKYGTRILITNFTRKAMGEAADEIFTIRLVDTVTVRGKSQSCKIYEVIDGDREEIRIFKKRILASYNEGVAHFYEHRFKEASECFEECVKIYPSDRPSQLFIERCNAHLVALTHPNLRGSDVDSPRFNDTE